LRDRDTYLERSKRARLHKCGSADGYWSLCSTRLIYKNTSRKFRLSTA
jgi:hypothetical protein